ncbi:glycine cleavage system H protein [Halyomorpha halys]|uniref:glycine cleavage system H protein n=1 Tax=Halyomorpha halys TaxID=286706 RepID=UPI0006D4D4DB|nr:glycine cleavage system H protein, mitochondrial [Halyomorpha halys]
MAQSLKYLGSVQPAFHQILAFSCHTVKSIRLCNQSYSRNYSTCVKNRFFSDKHEWVQVSGNIGIIGISKHAQESLGDIVYAQLPEVGTDVNQDDEVGALESVKAASELYSPVSGKVTEKNTEVEERPGLINESCYEKGWLFKVALTKPEELDKLMSEDNYGNFLKTAQH